MDAYRNGMDVHRVSIMVEILAASADDAVTYADQRIVTDAVVNDPRFVSFNITTPRRADS